MDESILGLIPFVVMMVVLGFRFGRQKDRKRIAITDYLRGVRYKNGVFVDVVGPGSYSFNARNEHIERVDMRPQPFVFESFSCSDALNQPITLSFAGEFEVADPRLAVSTMKKDSDEAFARLKQVIRTTASRLAVQDGSEATEKHLTETFLEEMNADLARSGLRIRNLELTEIWGYFTNRATTAPMA
jgi:hypothetical protein